MTVYDIIEKESRTLSEDKAIEVLDFIEFLRTRSLPTLTAKSAVSKRLNA